MEYVKLALVLELIVARGAISNENKYINTVFGGFFLKTCNHVLNKLVAESVGKYGYPLVHPLIPMPQKDFGILIYYSIKIK